ncbi:MAG: hypothetical protein AAGA06_04730 [Pseudomonadota bacterium]
MKGWIAIGSLVLAAVTFVLLWRARATYRELGCAETPDVGGCADALSSVYTFGGLGAVFAVIAILMMGRKGR